GAIIRAGQVVNATGPWANALGGLLGAPIPVRAAVQQVMADEATVLIDGVEVAFFPPVTGG
ncbi:MAG: MoaD/ThiS family protein, partial [Rubrivivax sp.]